MRLIRTVCAFALFALASAYLLDYLHAQKEYRSTELNYLTLIGSYLMAANQLNLAVGREVFP